MNLVLIMKNEEQLINNIIGQLGGIKKMLAEKRDCFSVLIQLKAVKSSVNSLTSKFIANNLENCLQFSCQKDRDEFKKILSELTKI